MVHEGHPDLVLVDTAVVAAAPTRWFVSGIGDALATHFEAQATAASGGRTIAGGRPTEAGGALAERCHDVVRANALPAVRAVREDRVTDAVEKTTEAVVLLSGLGFENGGLAAAHAIHDAISARVQSDATHGEKVCVGLLGQLHLEDRPETEIREVTRFARDVGLPVTLTAVGVSDADVDDVARAAFHEESTVGNQPSDPEPSDVARALRAVERLGRSMD
jgi:glycerol dehydrogenase